jgi:5-deoxy-glucuronate isomerase
MNLQYGRRYFETLTSETGLNRITDNPFTVLDFGLLRIPAGERHDFETSEREFGIDIISGVADVRVGKEEFETLGGRASVFDGKPTLVYAGHHQAVVIEAKTEVEIGLGSAPSKTDIAPYVIGPEGVRSGAWGRNTTRRYYNYMLGPETPTERLSFAEVTVSNGNWATYPPHKHEEGAEGEAFQEELYFYKVQPERGFGFCGQFGGKMPEDFAFPITNNTIHKMPFGYHTVTAAPGYSVCYLAVYAGHDKTHKVSAHPDHYWYAGDYERTLAHLERDFRRGE